MQSTYLPSGVVTVHALKLYLGELDMLVVKISEGLSLGVIYVDGYFVGVAANLLKGEKNFCNTKSATGLFSRGQAAGERKQSYLKIPLRVMW